MINLAIETRYARIESLNKTLGNLRPLYLEYSSLVFMGEDQQGE